MGKGAGAPGRSHDPPKAKPGRVGGAVFGWGGEAEPGLELEASWVPGLLGSVGLLGQQCPQEGTLQSRRPTRTSSRFQVARFPECTGKPHTGLKPEERLPGIFQIKSEVKACLEVASGLPSGVLHPL